MPCVFTQNNMSDFFNTSIALNVISSRLPIGVETMYRPGKKVSFCK